MAKKKTVSEPVTEEVAKEVVPTTNEESIVEGKDETTKVVIKEDKTPEEAKKIETIKAAKKKGLNAISNSEDIIEVEEDKTVVSNDEAVEVIDAIMAKHYKAHKVIGMKRIVNHLKKLLN